MNSPLTGIREERSAASDSSPRPFSDFTPFPSQRSALRAAITAAYRRPETECAPPLIAAATLPPPILAAAEITARKLVSALRAKPQGWGVEGLIHEYSLSSQEGVALMCLAEALLRIPDVATRDALIRDKIAAGNWGSHLGQGRTLFVNAATWGLLVTGKLTAAREGQGLSSALTRLIARGGEPLIRAAVDLAMRMMGEQFVTGQTIEEALDNSRAMEARSFRYSYDMLGEAATTAADAARYFADYESALHAIGKASAGRGIYAGPGISVKLSALHPRYSRAQIGRVMAELLPRIKALALLARKYDIGLNIDAEEADRLEISLDLLETLCADPDLDGWHGLGFVVQAYGKRCPFVIDLLIDLARRSGRRLMVRLVKGAYWDTEIKRAQVDGLVDFPVYTRKVHTDVSYLACARKLLAAHDVVFPQFATHNAQTLATIYEMAGRDFRTGDWEFQCLHGMGEGLYGEVVGADKLNRPCRIYAPVGTHETLLAYLVRRLLENGANSSFVNQIADPEISVDELVADPVAEAGAVEPLGAPHPKIALPWHIYGTERANSAGLDLSNEDALATLAVALKSSVDAAWTAAPLLDDREGSGVPMPVRNPADHRDIVGHVVEASAGDIDAAFAHARAAAPEWGATPPAERAAILMRAADIMETAMPTLLGLIMREAGKSATNAIAEVREAVDFLRYYAAEARRTLHDGEHRSLGPVVCISPWNFPLAIFTGQIAAALAAGNPVLAKPAEETPLIAAEAVRILHRAGIPSAVLQLLPGAGEVGAALVGNPDTAGVIFTGSTDVARLIQRQLAERLSPDGRLIPLIAETGGQNAMIVDSSALAEQVVTDVIASAFDSAGQRCSALRVLCLQEDVADRILAMLKGAMRELSIGNTERLSVDVGPVITAEARDNILAHVEAMRAQGHKVEALPLPPDTVEGTFVAPTLIEIGAMSDLTREVFGPVLHVLRFRPQRIGQLIDDINATGYGLTFGLHTRIDATIDEVTARIKAGNLYVNRNIIGAVVGVQPFGGGGLSGTGPKAGGPLYLRRLVNSAPAADQALAGTAIPPLPARAYCEWLESIGRAAEASRCRAYLAASLHGAHAELPGPVGESNLYELRPRGRVLALPKTEMGLFLQIGAALAAGNMVFVDAPGMAGGLAQLPAQFTRHVRIVSDWTEALPVSVVLAECEGEGEELIALNRRIAALPGPIIGVQAAASDALASGAADYRLEWLLEERSVSINTAAAGGNASLMALDE
jgi:RHH-type proline utilization regulon transcriptional repressor/proline dehydrogenase/delta 1-pyrroline-5-carboxylate dehydrogenase